MLRDFSKERFDIIIQAGQSNSYGCGFGKAERPFEDNSRVFYLNGSFMIVPATEQVWQNEIQGNYSLGFAREYIENGMLEEGRSLLILRTSEGGTGFADHRWDRTGDLFLRMMQMIRVAVSLNPENRVKALLWHQGENDVDAGMAEETYFDHLSGLVEAAREAAGSDAIPFVAGDFVPQWRVEKGEKCDPVRTATIRLCSGKFASYVETDGLLSNAQQNGGEDTIHFSRESLYRLGVRYFKAFEDICRG